jgi:hypothetical protein
MCAVLLFLTVDRSLNQAMFPSSPLKFRTAGFPRYGFKASLTDSASSANGSGGLEGQSRMFILEPNVRLQPRRLRMAAAAVG